MAYFPVNFDDKDVEQTQKEPTTIKNKKENDNE